MKAEKLSLHDLEIESYVTSLSIEEQANQKGGTSTLCGVAATLLGPELIEEFYEQLNELLDGALDDAWDSFDGFMGDLIGEDVWEDIKDFFEKLWEFLTY